MGDAVDVIVVGGGPAGAAAGAALAARGVTVAIVTTARGNPVRIGETVPPTIMQPLIGLGVHDEFLAGGHIAAPGTVVCWGDAEPYETDSITNPYGHGWHLDRARFDAMLLTAAVRAGAQMHQLDSFGTVEHGPDGWRVEVGERHVLRAPLLVDATGRSARIAMRHGATRRREDRLIGLVGFGVAGTDDHRTVIEACEQGWWYASVLPGGRAVTALMTDADLLPTSRVGRQQHWARCLAETVLVREVMVLRRLARCNCTPPRRARPHCRLLPARLGRCRRRCPHPGSTFRPGVNSGVPVGDPCRRGARRPPAHVRAERLRRRHTLSAPPSRVDRPALLPARKPLAAKPVLGAAPPAVSGDALSPLQEVNNNANRGVCCGPCGP